MILRAYQESPGGAPALTLPGARRPPPCHRGGLRALCCDGSRRAGEGAAEAQSPCAALAEPAAMQARSY